MEGENIERTTSIISVQTDQELPDVHQHVVTIDNKFFITVIETKSESKLREWIRGIQAIYGKKNRRNLIVGLVATYRQHYANSGCYHRPKVIEENRGEKPYDLLQLCVGSHCLLTQICPYTPMPRVLKDFLYDNRTIVVGVGIEKIAKKLEKDRQDDGLMIRRRVELRNEAEKCFAGNNFERCSLEELAKVVLGGSDDEVVFVKPKKIKWWGERIGQGFMYKSLSHEMIKYASVEAFLASKMGSNLLKEYSQ
ncbi:hypothetical protein REPUB_Repub19eG0104900 [Reevesia pubescens]